MESFVRKSDAANDLAHGTHAEAPFFAKGVEIMDMINGAVWANERQPISSESLGNVWTRGSTFCLCKTTFCVLRNVIAIQHPVVEFDVLGSEMLTPMAFTDSELIRDFRKCLQNNEAECLPTAKHPVLLQSGAFMGALAQAKAMPSPPAGKGIFRVANVTSVREQIEDHVNAAF